MDHIFIFMLYRMLIVCGGIASIYFGYKLFYIVKEKQGELRVKTGGDMEVHLSDVAPGVFFALFGAGILISSLAYTIKIEPEVAILSRHDPAPLTQIDSNTSGKAPSSESTANASSVVESRRSGIQGKASAVD